MPADYSSTALAVSSSSPRSLSPGSSTIRPQWAHSRPNSIVTVDEAVTFRDKLINYGRSLSRRVGVTWKRMTLWQRVGAIGAAIAASALGTAFMVFTGKIFMWLPSVADKWDKSPLVFFILWLCIFFVSFPPLIGWSTFGTVSGYLYGTWKG